MLSEILDEHRCFKLILGASNQNLEEIEELSYIYSLAGANLFDFSADKEVMTAVKSGIKMSGKSGIYLCTSVATEEDIHISKAIINGNCSKCGLCEKVCPQGAIKDFKVLTKMCVGCKKCFDVCQNNAIEFEYLEQNYVETLPSLIDLGLDSVEYHIGISDIDQIISRWKLLNDIVPDSFIVSVSISRNLFNDKKLLELLKRLLKDRKPYTTIIQADGKSISGGDDTFSSTLQTVSFAQLIREQNLPVYITLAGGTNSKSAELAKICNVDVNGVGVGSYARKIVRESLTEQEKIAAAKNLVQKTFEFLK